LLIGNTAWARTRTIWLQSEVCGVIEVCGGGRHLDLIITDERSYRMEDPFGRPETDALDDKDFRQFTAQEVIDILDGGRGYNNGKPPETIRAGEKEIPTELTGSPFAAGTNISALVSRSGGVILLASDAGNNKVLGFQIQNNGSLTPLPGSTVAAGSQPGALTFTFNDFVYVANHGSNNVSAYKFDFATSTLTPIAGSPFATGTSPVALGTTRPLQLYVADQGSSDLTGFNIDLNTGALTQIPGSPFHTPAPPSSIQTLFVMNVN
jgi:lactonase family protein with 7-bladed beta-propeller